MIVHDYGDGGNWYVIAVHYPTAVLAKRAWERLARKVDMSFGDQGVGVTRLAPNPNPGARSSGTPPGAHAVVIVTLDKATAAKAERLVRDGAPWTPVEGFAEALILRRAQVVSEHRGETGRLVIRRPDDRGAQLGDLGDLHEREPGEG